MNGRQTSNHEDFWIVGIVYKKNLSPILAASTDHPQRKMIKLQQLHLYNRQQEMLWQQSIVPGNIVLSKESFDGTTQTGATHLSASEQQQCLGLILGSAASNKRR